MTPLEYEIHITGSVAATVLDEVEDVRVSVEPAGSILSGAVVDQAAFHGLINRLQAAGLEVLEIRRRLPAANPPTPAGSGPKTPLSEE